MFGRELMLEMMCMVRQQTVFLNGIIHWVVTSHSVPQYIYIYIYIYLYSFDVEDECFQLVPPPLEIESPER